MPSASHFPFGSVNASVAIVSPLAMPGSSASFSSSVPAFRIALAARTTVEKYGAHSSARPMLLEHDAELDEREALAAVLLGDRQALQAELVRHLRPDRRVVALGRLHEPAHLALGALRLEELPHGVAQLVLLFREREVHRGSFSPWGDGLSGLRGRPSTRSPMMLR